MVQKLNTNSRQLAQARTTVTTERTYMILYFRKEFNCTSCKEDTLNPKDYITPAICILFKDVIGKLANIAITFSEAQ